MARVVSFARINRRQENLLSPLVEPTDFHSDLTELVESQETRALVDGLYWIAGDFERDASGDLVTGILGYESSEQFVEFDEEANSWMKGPTHEVSGATSKTMVPFAIDMRNDSRYICFAQQPTISAARFCRAFGAVLAAAVEAQGWVGQLWEVDLVAEPNDLLEWLAQNPNITKIVRVVKRPNPSGEYLQDDLNKMNLVHARRLKEEYSVGQGRGQHSMSAESPEAQSLLTDGLEQGNVEITATAKGAGGLGSTFSSKVSRAKSTVASFNDPRVGGERVLGALRDFVTTRLGLGQGTLGDGD